MKNLTKLLTAYSAPQAMINLNKHNRFNYIKIDKESISILDGFSSPSLLTMALDNLGLEHVSSKFPTDFDFFIAETNGDLVKNRYYGKPIYLADDVIRSLLSGRQNNLECPTFYEDYLPMLMSKDSPTAALGYDLIIRCFSYLDWAHISFLTAGRIYPYNRIFYFSNFYANTLAYKSSKNLHALFAAHSHSQRLKDPVF